MKLSEKLRHCQVLIGVLNGVFFSYKYYKIIKNSYDYKIIGYRTRLRPTIGLFLLNFLPLVVTLASGAREIYRKQTKNY